MDRIRVHERDLEPEEPLARFAVDQVRARIGELGERRPQIGHLVGDVMHPRAALGKKPPDRCVAAQRLEQFDTPVADAKRRRPHTLVVDRCAVLDLRTEEPCVGRKRLVEVLHRHAKMMNPPRLHAGEATERGC